MTENTNKLITHLESIGYVESYSGENLIFLHNIEKQIYVSVDTQNGIFQIQPQKVMHTYAAILPIETTEQLDVILALCEKLPKNAFSQAQYSFWQSVE